MAGRVGSLLTMGAGREVTTAVEDSKSDGSASGFS